MTTWTVELHSTKPNTNSNNFDESQNRLPLSICNSFRLQELSIKFLESTPSSARNWRQVLSRALAGLEGTGLMTPRRYRPASLLVSTVSSDPRSEQLVKAAFNSSAPRTPFACRDHGCFKPRKCRKMGRARSNLSKIRVSEFSNSRACYRQLSQPLENRSPERI